MTEQAGIAETQRYNEANAAAPTAAIVAAVVALRNMRQHWLNGNLPFWIDHTNSVVDGSASGEGCTYSHSGYRAVTYAGGDEIHTARKDRHNAEAIDKHLPDLKISGEFLPGGKVVSRRVASDGNVEERVTQLGLKPAPFLGIRQFGSEELLGWSTDIYKNGVLQEKRFAEFTMHQTEASHGEIRERIYLPGATTPSRQYQIDFKTNALPFTSDRACARKIDGTGG